jgi:predicted DNA-binding transcriptional regulator AlpA
MTTEYLGIKQVSERLGVANAASYDLPEPDVTIGRTRGWLPETIDQWDAQRPGRASAADAHAKTRPNNKKPLPQRRS